MGQMRFRQKKGRVGDAEEEGTCERHHWRERRVRNMVDWQRNEEEKMKVLLKEDEWTCIEG